MMHTCWWNQILRSHRGCPVPMPDSSLPSKTSLMDSAQLAFPRSLIPTTVHRLPSEAKPDRFVLCLGSLRTPAPP